MCMMSVCHWLLLLFFFISADYFQLCLEIFLVNKILVLYPEENSPRDPSTAC